MSHYDKKDTAAGGGCQTRSCGHNQGVRNGLERISSRPTFGQLVPRLPRFLLDRPITVNEISVCSYLAPIEFARANFVVSSRWISRFESSNKEK